MLFDLKHRSEITLEVMSEEQRERVFALRHEQFMESGDELLKEFFLHLRQLAGDPDEVVSTMPTDSSSSELWSAFRLADMRARSGKLLEDEWRGLWDVL